MTVSGKIGTVTVEGTTTITTEEGTTVGTTTGSVTIQTEEEAALNSLNYLEEANNDEGYTEFKSSLESSSEVLNLTTGEGSAYDALKDEEGVRVGAQLAVAKDVLANMPDGGYEDALAVQEAFNEAVEFRSWTAAYVSIAKVNPNEVNLFTTAIEDIQAASFVLSANGETSDLVLEGNVYTVTNDTDNYIKFAASASTSVEFEKVELKLTESLDDALINLILAQYSGKPVEYQEYLESALAGTNAYAVITKEDGKLVLKDGAKLSEGSNNANLGMEIPQGFPVGTYTVEGTIGEATVTFTIVVETP